MDSNDFYQVKVTGLDVWMWGGGARKVRGHFQGSHRELGGRLCKLGRTEDAFFIASSTHPSIPSHPISPRCLTDTCSPLLIDSSHPFSHCLPQILLEETRGIGGGISHSCLSSSTL